MRFIEHIVEPKRLLLAWQSSDERYRTRYIVAELRRLGDETTLTYLPETKDFIQAKNIGFDAYPAFRDTNKIHHNVQDAFMRRLPPRSRGDFTHYLERLRLKPELKISDFALMGYSGAKLLSDGFSLIHPFDDIAGPCEFLTEVAGFRHIPSNDKNALNVGNIVTFSQEFNQTVQEEAISVKAGGIHIGYINRCLVPTFSKLLSEKTSMSAWIEKLNGTQDKPVVYFFVEIKPKI